MVLFHHFVRWPTLYFALVHTLVAFNNYVFVYAPPPPPPPCDKIGVYYCLNCLSFLANVKMEWQEEMSDLELLVAVNCHSEVRTYK